MSLFASMQILKPLLLLTLAASVYVTVGCPSVCLSVPSIVPASEQQRRAAVLPQIERGRQLSIDRFRRRQSAAAGSVML